jgi:Diadenosine tetraphosphate (Ap4A) hydrolase and other HIT family hydrolases
MLNIYPYNNGHVMVAPYRHVNSLEYLKPEELKDLMDLVVKTKKTLDKKIKPDGYNIGLNLGRVAGAGFAGHIHIHVVPRWTGDNNFMPAACGTKVISESLDEMCRIYKSK